MAKDQHEPDDRIHSGGKVALGTQEDNCSGCVPVLSLGFSHYQMFERDPRCEVERFHIRRQQQHNNKDGRSKIILQLSDGFIT